MFLIRATLLNSIAVLGATSCASLIGSLHKICETFLPAAGCTNMRSLLYIIVVILVISWLLGGFVFNVGGDAIHIILVIAVIILLLNLINGGSRLDRGRWW
jgi:hypothetical protein